MAAPLPPLRERFSIRHLRAHLDQARRARAHAVAPDAGAWIGGGIATAVLAGVAVYALAGGHGAGFHLLNEAGRPVPGWLLANLTELGNTAVLGALVATGARRHPQMLIAVVVAVLAGAVVINGLKDLLGVARPPAVIAADELRLVGTAYTTGSFPSGHTFATFSVAGVLLAFTRSRVRRLALLLGAAAIGFTRVLIGVHWPLDVLAGAAGGLAVAGLGVLVSRTWSGGFHPVSHLVLLALVLISPLVLLVDGANYEKADPFAATLAILSLTIVAWEYLVRGPRQPAQPCPDAPARRRGATAAPRRR